jgi:hypothetical protein
VVSRGFSSTGVSSTATAVSFFGTWAVPFENLVPSAQRIVR